MPHKKAPDGSTPSPHLSFVPGEFFRVSSHQVESFSVSADSHASRMWAYLLRSAMGNVDRRGRSGGRLAVRYEKGKPVPITPADVCRRIGIDRRHFSRVCGVLERAGLVRKRTFPSGPTALFLYVHPIPREPVPVPDTEPALESKPNLSSVLAPLRKFLASAKIILADPEMVARIQSVILATVENLEKELEQAGYSTKFGDKGEAGMSPRMDQNVTSGGDMYPYCNNTYIHRDSPPPKSAPRIDRSGSHPPAAAAENPSPTPEKPILSPQEKFRLELEENTHLPVDSRLLAKICAILPDSDEALRSEFCGWLAHLNGSVRSPGLIPRKARDFVEHRGRQKILENLRHRFEKDQEQEVQSVLQREIDFARKDWASLSDKDRDFYLRTFPDQFQDLMQMEESHS